MINCRMKALCMVTAVTEVGAGLALLACASATATLMLGAPLETAAALSVARLGGAGLLALGVACWLSRDDTQSRAARGLIVAMLLYNVAAFAILAFASLGFGMHGVALWPTVVLHALLAVWCVTCLRFKSVPQSRSNQKNIV
jgi:hypothetical protein